MLDAARDDDELPSRSRRSCPGIPSEAPLHEEQLVLIVVVVPDELAEELDQLDVCPFNSPTIFGFHRSSKSAASPRCSLYRRYQCTSAPPGCAEEVPLVCFPEILQAHVYEIPDLEPVPAGPPFVSHPPKAFCRSSHRSPGLRPENCSRFSEESRLHPGADSSRSHPSYSNPTRPASAISASATGSPPPDRSCAVSTSPERIMSRTRSESLFLRREIRPRRSARDLAVHHLQVVGACKEGPCGPPPSDHYHVSLALEGRRGMTVTSLKRRPSRPTGSGRWLRLRSRCRGLRCRSRPACRGLRTPRPYPRCTRRAGSSLWLLGAAEVEAVRDGDRLAPTHERLLYASATVAAPPPRGSR